MQNWRTSSILGSRISSNLYNILLALILVLALSACASRDRPKESAEYRDKVPQEGIALAVAQNSVDTGAAQNTADGKLEILALSSGGAYGAFGVGVLNGWSERGTRPNFDIVTGVSTGAIISVFAFLGPKYDHLMRDLYINVSNKDIYRKRSYDLLYSDSLYDNAALKKRIEHYVTPQLLKDVAAEHAKGRRLYVGTTNLDGGKVVIWDMGKIASGGRTDPLTHFRKVIRASASVPGFFPPVYIKPQRGVQLRQAHVDGGLKSPLLVEDFMFNSRVANQSLYVIANDNIENQNAFEAIDGSLLSVAQKSLATLAKELLIQNVYRAYVKAVNSNTKFYMTSVPERFLENARSLNFEPRVLKELYEVGREVGLKGNRWLRKPHHIGRYDIVKNQRKGS